MPGFTTHYLFGRNTYKHLDDIPLKKTLRKYHAAYSIGLQGPDIFFYHLPSYLPHTDHPGSIAHTKHTGLFLYYLLESRRLFSNSKERRIAEAYICGFLGHYTLDTCCHPYIYWKTGFKEKSSPYYSKHIRLETDIDTRLLQLYNPSSASCFHPRATICLTRRELRTIAAVLSFTYQKTYPNLHVSCNTVYTAIRSMQIGTRFLEDSSGRKKALLHRLEILTLGYPLLSAMIPDNSLSFCSDPLNMLRRKWHNPWNKNFASRASFPDLIAEAQTEYTAVLTALSGIFSKQSSSRLEQKEITALFTQLGSRSYHSGLES